jgi:hypothetical protein
MKLFKRQRKVDISDDAVAKKIANKIVEKQRNLANYLNSKTKRFSPRTIAFILFGLCIVFGGYCAFLLLNAIN